MTQEKLINYSLNLNTGYISPKFLKYIKNPELKDGYVFLSLDKDNFSFISASPKVDKHRLNSTLFFIKKVINDFGLNLNFKFILNTYDEPSVGDIPIFGFCGNKFEKKSNILIPDPHITGKYLGVEIKDELNFQEKKESIIFRGSDTGSFPIAQKNERINACWKTKNDAKIDFKISNFVRYSKDILKESGVNIDKISSPYLSFKDQLQHKYIADINGNSAAWDRPCWVLGSNSILFKIQTETKSDETWYSRYMLHQGIVPRLNIEELKEASKENFNFLKLLNISPTTLNSKQKQFSKILLDYSTHQTYLKEVLVKYNKQYNS